MHDSEDKETSADEVRTENTNNNKKNPGWGEIFRTRPDRSGAHPASYTMRIGSHSRGQNGWGVALTTHLHLATRLKKE
jgi:hypothetical protein